MRRDLDHPASERAAVRDEARRAANRMIGFLGHAIVFCSTVVFLWFVAGFVPAAIVALAWSIALASHGFFGVLAPILRREWVADAVERRVSATLVDERRVIEGKHARSIEALSASIAHEIRNPITAAKSLVAQIAEDPASADNVEYARVALEELDRVERSIAHLLRYAREEAVELRDVTLAEVADGALETLRDRLAKSGVELRRDLDPHGVVFADPEKLRRVVINLVANALEALDLGNVPDATIELSCGENLAGTEVWLRVRDNGPGIPTASLDRIFSPFHTSKESGTGLGLAISKKLVEAHGGTLEVRSSRGTEFTITLPKRGKGRGAPALPPHPTSSPELG